MVVMSFSHSNLCRILPFPRYFNFASIFLKGLRQNVLGLSVRTCVRAYLSGRRHSVTGFYAQFIYETLSKWPNRYCKCRRSVGATSREDTLAVSRMRQG